MKSCVVHLLTGRDNETLDIGRVLWVAGVLWFMLIGGWAVIGKGQAFDPSGYGTGLGIVLAAGGIGVAAKAKTEPGA